MGVVALSIVCLVWNTSQVPNEQLGLPIPLNSDTAYGDYGYFSVEPSSRVFSEIRRALKKADLNSTSPAAPPFVVDVSGLSNSSQNENSPVREVSVFDRVKAMSTTLK